MARGGQGEASAVARSPAPVGRVLAGFAAGVGVAALALAGVVQMNAFVRYGLDLAVASAVKSFPPPYFWPALLALLGLLALAGAVFLWVPGGYAQRPSLAREGMASDAAGTEDDDLMLKAPDLALLTGRWAGGSQTPVGNTGIGRVHH